MDALYYVFIGLFLLIVLFSIYFKFRSRYFGELLILNDEGGFQMAINIFYSENDIMKMKDGQCVKVKIIKKRKY